MIQIVISILVFAEILFIVVFPTIGILGGTVFHTLGMYLLIPLSFILYMKDHILKHDILGKRYLKVTFIFVFLLLIGAFMGFILGSGTIILHDIFSYVILFFYAFVFYVFSFYPVVRKTIIIAILFSGFLLGAYSIFSYVTSSNLYIDFFEPFFRSSDVEDTFQDYSETRGLSHRVFGNVNNPVFFSGELMMLLAFCCYMFVRIKSGIINKILLLALISIVFGGTVFTGSKSGLIPSAFFLFFLLFNINGFAKGFLYISIVFFLLLLLSPVMEATLDFNFITFLLALNPSNEDVAGSSLSWRIEQYSYLFDFVGNDFLFGKGIGYCQQYNIRHGIHPILHTFESLVMSSFVEGGVWGALIVWPTFLIGYYKLKIRRKVFPFYRVFLLGFYFFLFATGLGMTKFFYVWMGIMIRDYNNDFYLYDRKKAKVVSNVPSPVPLHSGK